MSAEGGGGGSGRAVPPASPAAPKDQPFPAIMGAALITGGLVWAVDRVDRRAATVLTVTLLLGIALARDITGKVDEFIAAVTGK